MQRFRFVLSLVALTLPAIAAAQTAVGPAGHWEGSVRLRDGDMAIVVDITNERTQLGGTMGMPSQDVTNLPLQMVTFRDAIVAFQARRDQPFSGVLAADGESITGTFRMESDDFPFTLRRLGQAKTYAALVSAPVTVELAGQWDAVVAEAGASMRVVLSVSNHADGTAGGLLVNETEGGLQIPLVIVQSGRDVTLKAPGVAGAFIGTLNAERSTLQGTWTQGATRLPVTFVRRGDHQ